MRPQLSIVLLALSALAAAHARAANTVWLEAERFADCGGWTRDAQFLDQMGSPYLMAVGLGRPVADARTRVTPPGPGRYRLWVRTRDWVPEHHPGRFQVVLGGKPLEKTFGASGRPGWHWEDGGLHPLAGPVEVRLHDLTGYYGRCDAVLLCDDPGWTPPEDKRAIAAEREKHGGTSRQVRTAGRYDVVVVGGGLAGCMAAVSSARQGRRTVLIQDRPVLGGNASVEILVPPVGVWPHANRDPLDPRESGLVGEIRTEGNQRVSEAKLYSGRLMRLVRAEPNLELRLNTHATRVEMEAKTTIAAVLAVDVLTGERLRFPGRVFVDCTGDGAVGVAAGAEFRHGKEPRSMYGESLAPEKASRQTMGNSIKYVSQPADGPQPFVAPDWAMKFPTCESFAPGRHPLLGGRIGWQWKIELGGTRDTYADAEEIRDELLRLVYGMWDHVKNHCNKLQDRAANHRLVWVGHVAGKRENRRLIGDYVLTQNDIRDQVLFPDRVAYGGWCIDDHFSGGFFYAGPTMGESPYKGLPYSIPSRSLYSKNVGNLLMAGRDISASHVALSDTRVMLTCAVIGQAAGTAAALCVEYGTTPRGIYRDHLAELQQQLLKDGAYLIDLPNRDPRDLARSAAASASSENTRERGRVMGAANVVDGCARAEGGKTHAWGPGPGAPMPQWVQIAWPGPQTFNVVHVTFQTKDRAPARFALQVPEGGSWKTLAEVAGCRHRRYVLGLARTTAAKLRVVLLESKGREPGVCEVRVYDEPARVVECARRALRTMMLPDEKPALPWDDSLTEITGVDPRKLDGIVLDDTQAEAAGDWVESDFSGRFVLRGYAHDGNTGKGTKSLRFVPDVPRDGRYEIRLAYAAYPNRATNTPVEVRTPAGSKTVRVNQRQKPPGDGLFLSLGTFELRAGRANSIVVSNAGTDGYVVADAIQLIPAKGK